MYVAYIAVLTCLNVIIELRNMDICMYKWYQSNVTSIKVMYNAFSRVYSKFLFI